MSRVDVGHEVKVYSLDNLSNWIGRGTVKCIGAGVVIVATAAGSQLFKLSTVALEIDESHGQELRPANVGKMPQIKNPTTGSGFVDHSVTCHFSDDETLAHSSSRVNGQSVQKPRYWR